MMEAVVYRTRNQTYSDFNSRSQVVGGQKKGEGSSPRVNGVGNSRAGSNAESRFPILCSVSLDISKNICKSNLIDLIRENQSDKIRFFIMCHAIKRHKGSINPHNAAIITLIHHLPVSTTPRLHVFTFIQSYLPVASTLWFGFPIVWSHRLNRWVWASRRTASYIASPMRRSHVFPFPSYCLLSLCRLLSTMTFYAYHAPTSHAPDDIPLYW